jgi:hypothetical protein
VTIRAAASLSSSRSTRSPSASTAIGSTCQPGLFDDQPVVVPARVLERDAGDAAAAQPARDQREALAEAGADDQLLGIGGGAADPAQVLGERFAQRRHAARIGVVDGVDRRLSPGGAQRAQPAVAGEAGQVGEVGIEAMGEAGQQRGGGGTRRGRPHRVGNPYRRALAGKQVTLGRELAVGLADHAA